MIKVNFPPILNGKTNIIIMKVIDKTKCKRPQTGEEFNLTVEHHAARQPPYCIALVSGCPSSQITIK